jgi:UDP-3-O-[3-hydroxymyristoyl] glucosamine N-acyltransferase
MKMDTQLDIYKSIRRLPRILKDIAQLKKTISKSE